MSHQVEVPRFQELLWPTLCAIEQLGGSASTGEILEKVVEREGLTEEQQSRLRRDGPETILGNRLGWARSYLKKAGALENSARGVWSITDTGRQLTPEDMAGVVSIAAAAWRQEQKEVQASTQLETDEQPAAEDDWKQQLLSTLLEMPPDAFERLSRRLLREAGFVNVLVTGKSGDGGIDGTGVSFIVFPS